MIGCVFDGIASVRASPKWTPWAMIAIFGNFRFEFSDSPSQHVFICTSCTIHEDALCTNIPHLCRSAHWSLNHLTPLPVPFEMATTYPNVGA
jgi:hypothetical protein